MDKKLPKAFKNKWVKALRSGKYKQGRKLLRNSIDNTYCCLGVAAEIAGCYRIKGGWIESKKGMRGISKVPKMLRGESTIPTQLANMNDNGKTFRQIATYIDKKL